MADPDDSLRAFSGYTMKRAFNAIQADVNATLQPYGLRMVTFSALVVIADNPGLNQSRLAEVLSIERPNLVLIIDELDRAELITRDRAKADRRAYELRATLKGRRVCDRARAAVAAHDARMTAGLSEAERGALIAALRRIEANGAGGEADERQQLSGA
jgi:DNA-binding MarR family transcriptional regulator